MAPQSWAIKRPGRLMEISNFGAPWAPWAHGVRPGTPKFHPWAPGAHGVRHGTPQGPWGPGGVVFLKSKKYGGNEGLTKKFDFFAFW